MDPDELKRMKKNERDQRMGLTEYTALLDNLPPCVTQVSVVGGGEPLIHPECIEIMQEIKRRRLRGYLISNGTLMKENVVNTMVNMRWDLSRISVHAGDPETYRKIQGVDHFERLRTCLKTFDQIRREAGAIDRCVFHVHNALQRENISTAQIEKIFEFAEDVGADFIDFEIIFPLSKEKLLTGDELNRAGQVLAACATKSKIPCNLNRILPQLCKEESSVREEKTFRPANRCSVGFDSAFITAYGDVKPCCFSDEVMGNVCQQSFREIWYGEKYENFRKRLNNGKFAGYCIANRCKLTQFLHNQLWT
jgi:MoaA/NifB/PqqE/SkfB family radical SAM enzyme